MALNKLTIKSDLFNRFKKSVLGSFLKSLNNIDFVGFSYLEYLYKDSDLFAAVELFEKVKLEDLKSLTKYFTPAAWADYTILPKKFGANY